MKNRDEFPKTGSSQIELRGARIHNLRGIDLDIPHRAMTVITGVSGSGKSSLVFDTLFAEGQRQYIHSLSAASRRFVDVLPRPPMDSIRGLQPTLCIDQRHGAGDRRSTVASLAEVSDYLRLLFARVGTPYCHQCGSVIQQQSLSDVVRDIASHDLGTKVTVLAPVVRGKQGAHHAAIEAIRKHGLLKIRVDGVLAEIDELADLSAHRSHTIDAVCDRIVLREDATDRIEAAVKLALQLADGLVVVIFGDAEKLYSTKYACPSCGVGYAEIEPRIFSFHSPHGACPECKGLGCITNQPLTHASKKMNADAAVMEESWSQAEESRPSEDLSLTLPCPACQGTRLRAESRSILIDGLSIDRVLNLTIDEATVWFAKLTWQNLAAQIGNPIRQEVMQRLSFLKTMGLGYLSLDRTADSLSGGERQRVRLASCLGSGLIGVCYILDEPSIGLHPRDSLRLIETLQQLRDLGNTLVVVEHDTQVMLAADFLVDIGPGAGPLGGSLLAQGTPSSVAKHPNSITGPYLRQAASTSFREPRRTPTENSVIRIVNARKHNLKSIQVEIPLKCLVGITGVSGSGKSSLILDTLVPAVRTTMRHSATNSSNACDAIEGLDKIDKLIVVDQRAIGRTSRSTPATYIGVWDLIRDVFAETREAKQRGFKASRFSFNSGTGRCETCQGKGERTISMGFMADVYATCSRCQGKRFNRATLAARYRDKNISDILDMNAREALDFFQNFDKVARILTAMTRVGLGYLKLGQPSHTLSGGEAQRIKLAAELARTETSKTLYVLDEPTTGLHPMDVEQLLEALHALIDRGNTVVIIEHHLDVIRSCDWLIDLGPEGGPAGGDLVVAGPPATIAAHPSSLTGQALRGGEYTRS